jgi:hypothetical protein
MPELTLRYAASDADVVAIHAFLCHVAMPNLPAQIDAKESATEVWRLVNKECALMAMQGDILVGTLGILQAKYWWGTGHYYVNRWFFALPRLGAGALLLREAIRIAKADGLELHIIDEAKQRYRIFNRHPRRDVVPPFVLTPRLPTHEASHTIQ